MTEQAKKPTKDAEQDMPSNKTSSRRGRPPTGQAVEGKDRSAKSKAKLIESGGRRLTTTLGPEAVQALETIKAHKGYEKDKQGLEDALLYRASKIR